MKKPYAAVLLNIIPGVGYLYLGTRKVFAYILILSSVTSLLAAFFDPDAFNLSPWIAATSIIAQIAFMVDAYFEAKALNQTVK